MSRTARWSRAGRGPGLLLATALVTIVLLGLRLAELAPARPAVAADPLPAAAGAEAPPPAADLAPAWPSAHGQRFDLPTPDSLARMLRAREAAIEQREAELLLREEALLAAQARLETEILRLDGLGRELRALASDLEEEEEERARSLARMYEAMRPKDAARIFNRLELPLLLRVVTRMREIKTAPVLAQMDPSVAQRLTAELARHHDLERLTGGPGS